MIFCKRMLCDYCLPVRDVSSRNFVLLFGDRRFCSMQNEVRSQYGPDCRLQRSVGAVMGSDFGQGTSPFQVFTLALVLAASIVPTVSAKRTAKPHQGTTKFKANPKTTEQVGDGSVNLPAIGRRSGGLWPAEKLRKQLEKRRSIQEHVEALDRGSRIDYWAKLCRKNAEKRKKTRKLMLTHQTRKSVSAFDTVAGGKRSDNGRIRGQAGRHHRCIALQRKRVGSRMQTRMKVVDGTKEDLVYQRRRREVKSNDGENPKNSGSSVDSVENIEISDNGVDSVLTTAITANDTEWLHQKQDGECEDEVAGGNGINKKEGDGRRFEPREPQVALPSDGGSINGQRERTAPKVQDADPLGIAPVSLGSVLHTRRPRKLRF
eukprot:jgi/Bigna1/66853/fgenesh1_pg.2_\